jgi:Fe-S oxidoreductase
MESLKDYLYTMVSCNQCGQCKWILGPKMRGWRYAEVCPIHARFGFDAYSGQGLINIAQELLEGRLKYEEGLIRLIYTCMTCGACDINCKSIRDMEVLDTILALRAKCVEDGQAPLPEHKDYARHIEKTGNIYGKPRRRRSDWLPEGIRLSADSGVAYFAGCAASYLHPEIAVNTVRILNAAGIDFKILGAEEHCCGAPLWRTGQIEAFRKVIAQNLDAWKRQGVNTIITSCAECFGTFRGGYPRFAGMDIEVLHITEVVRNALREGKLKPDRKLNMRVTYHDPCLLGRLSEKYIPWNGEIKAFGLHEPPKPWRRGTYGVYEAPREILKSIPGIELVEMPRNEENSFCCGAGGGVPAVFPELAQWAAAERLDEAKSTGAEAIVSCCPFCEDNFVKAINGNHGVLRYYDLTELVAQML